MPLRIHDLEVAAITSPIKLRRFIAIASVIFHTLSLTRITQGYHGWGRQGMSRVQPESELQFYFSSIRLLQITPCSSFHQPFLAQLRLYSLARFSDQASTPKSQPGRSARWHETLCAFCRQPHSRCTLYRDRATPA